VKARCYDEQADVPHALRDKRAEGLAAADEWEARTHSAMAGGDFALIKSVEGFEDFTQFGAKQIADMGVSEGDVVIAITEGGETSFVIGTAWEGLRKGAKVYFMYNNPDDVLCEHVIRSREVIEDPRIEKINVTTGPMGIMGSTRMQATTIELCVMVTILEMVLRDIMATVDPNGDYPSSSTVPQEFMGALNEVLSTLLSREILAPLAELVKMEAASYKARKKSTYFADSFGIDIMTDTTERSPTTRSTGTSSASGRTTFRTRRASDARP
jgi:N-acetylmuramic acid 6-phosphate etherase